MIITFQNNLTLHSTSLTSLVNTETIEVEPMLYGASAGFARDNGGLLTRAFLDAVSKTIGAPLDGMPVIVDTRVHMLKPGMLPAIGGWHCDAVPRGDTGQPDLSQLATGSDRHFTMTLSDKPDLSRTRLMAFPARLNIGAGDGTVWSRVHASVTEQGDPGSVLAPHGMLAEFSRDTLHKATKAETDGWRFFARASLRPGARAQNKIRRQVQVYIDSEGAGW